MLDILIILGGAVYAGINAMRERSAAVQGVKPDIAAAVSAAAVPVAAGQSAVVPVATSAAYQMLDTEKADHYLQVAGVALGTSALALVFPPAGLVAVSLLTYLALPLYKSATIGALVERRPRSSMVGAVLTLASLGSGYYLLVAGSSLGFFLSYKLMIKTQAGSGPRVARILGASPRQVWLAYADSEVGVPFESLRAGDVIVLRAGEWVPIDGTVVQGMASVDQRTLTGESHVVDKIPGDIVLASTTVVAGKLHVRVEKAGEQTAVAHIERILDDTADYTAAVEQKAGAVCDRLAGPTLAAGGATALLLGPVHGVALIGCNLTEVNRATTPLTMLNYLDLSARQGILVKDGRSLELLSGIDTVVFDKTGTLTLEQPHIGEIHCLGDLDADAVLCLAAAAGRQQTHPVARAVVLAATERGLSLPELDDARYEIGYGVKVVLGKRNVCLGSRRFMHKEGIHVADPEGLATLQKHSEQRGCSLLFVAADALLVGVIEIHSTLRPEAFAVVKRLKTRGLKLAIVSGDAEAPTRGIARALGIEDCHAGVLPDEKAAIVRQLREQGRSICFVGDGINDTVALKTATVGISLSGSANVALDTAGIILMEQNLDRLEVLFDLAAEMERYRQRGYYATLVPGAAGAAGVLFFGMGLPAALLLDMFGIGAALGTAMWPKYVARSTIQPLSRKASSSSALSQSSPKFAVNLLRAGQ